MRARQCTRNEQGYNFHLGWTDADAARDPQVFLRRKIEIQGVGGQATPVPAIRQPTGPPRAPSPPFHRLPFSSYGPALLLSLSLPSFATYMTRPYPVCRNRTCAALPEK